jgi:hypothetical protein
MMFHGVLATQKMEMMSVARKMFMYFGAKPETSLEKGYVPAAIWLPIVASMNEKPVKNLAARESNLAITAGMYHSNEPQRYECALVTNILWIG